MTYEAFLEKVKSEISRRFEDNYEVYIQKFPKNNGIVYDGLSISIRNVIWHQRSI